MNASQLLSELREAIREGRELLADYKALLKELKGQRVAAEKMIADIRDGEVSAHIQECVNKGLEEYGEVLIKACDEVRGGIEDRMDRLVASVLGVPPEAIQNGLKVMMKNGDVLGTGRMGGPPL